MSFTTAPVQDGSVRLDRVANSQASIILKPEDGGGIMLWDPGTNAWRMTQVPSGGVTVDCTSCAIDGLGGKTIRRMVNPQPTRMDFEWTNLYPPGDYLTWWYNPGNGFGGFVKARGAKWNGPGQGSGKPYFEVTLHHGDRFVAAGLTSALASYSDVFAPTFFGVRVSGVNGSPYFITADGVAYSINLGTAQEGDVLRFATDFETGPIFTRVWISLNGGPWNGDSAHAPGGSGGINIISSGPVTPFIAFYAGGTAWSVITGNFGATPFAYSVPTGFTSGWTEHAEFYNWWGGPVYDVFAKSDAAGNISLDLSLGKAYTVDAATGFRVKTTDPTQRLVGRAGVILNGNMSVGPLGADLPNCQMVASWFKPKRKEIKQLLIGGVFANTLLPQWGMINRYKDGLHFVSFEEDGYLPSLQSSGTIIDTVGSGGASAFCILVRNQAGINTNYMGGGSSVVAGVPFEYYTTIGDDWARMAPNPVISFHYGLALTNYGGLGSASFYGSYLRAHCWM